MSDKIPYLFERDGSFYFRRRIPRRLHAPAGCTEWKLALGRTGAARAHILLELKLLTETTNAAAAALRRNECVSPTLLLNALATLYPERQEINRITIREAGRQYANEKALKDLKKPELMAVEQFVAFAGDLPLRQINRKSVRGWIAWLRNERGQSGATIRRRLGSLSAIFAHAVEIEEGTLTNPFAGQKLPRFEAGYRLPFHKTHLTLLEQWLSGPNGKRATGQIIRLLRATGARPLEIGGLLSEDIRLDAQVPFLMVHPNTLRGLKTPSSQRALPLVGDGLAAAKELVAATSTGALFSSTCHDTGALSARLNKALRAAGIPHSKQLTAYSFRHTVEEALRVTDAPFDVQQAILGHAKRSSTERYGARHVSLARMKSSLEKAMLALGLVDAWNNENEYSAENPENPNARGI